ncbi:MAG: ribonuclease PH [Holosporales bacterium]|jgi:ribonuclease PH|nr:ribonuclease PH [Holosporales bacterium]
MQKTNNVKRISGRANDELRQIALIPNYYNYGDGSCFVKFGNTHIICAATIEEKTPLFLRNTRTGWISAEYGILPCSCSDRTDREAAKGKQSGRTQEIQRLIGRSLRSVVDLSILGERQIKIDCDAIQADGGTRTASITGAYIALYIACQKLLKKGKMERNPIKSHVVAVSCGIVNDAVLLDLNYAEDSKAEVDSNFIMSDDKIIEIQSCGEQRPFSEDEFFQLLNYAKKARKELIEKQKIALRLQ